MAEPIVFIGDSITELWGFHRAGTFEAYDLIPRGGSGQTARWITMRFARDLAETEAWGVHLLCGVNDIGRNEGAFVSVGGICRTLAGMLDEARVLGVRAWIGSLTPVDGIPWNPEVRDAPAMIAAVNAWLRDHAHEHGATFIDYHAVLATETGGLRPDYGTDGLHLSPAGYAAIEPLMLRALGRIPEAPPEPMSSAKGTPAKATRTTRARLIGVAVAAAALFAAVAALVLELR